MVILVMIEHVGTVNTRIDRLQVEKKKKKMERQKYVSGKRTK